MLPFIYNEGRKVASDKLHVTTWEKSHIWGPTREAADCIALMAFSYYYMSNDTYTLAYIELIYSNWKFCTRAEVTVKG